MLADRKDDNKMRIKRQFEIALQTCLLVCLMVCSCNQSTNSGAGADDDTDNYDWTPAGYKEAHPDEWKVIIGVSREEFKSGETDFRVVDSLVLGYAAAHNVKIPDDEIARIEAIDSLCHTAFLVELDDPNTFSLARGASTDVFWNDYIAWLYKNLVLQKSLISAEQIEEEELYWKNLIDSLTDACESFHLCDGSIRWVTYTSLSAKENRYFKDLFRCFLGVKIRELPIRKFSGKDFHKAIENTIRYHTETYPEDSESMETGPILTFESRFHEWSDFRNRTCRSGKMPKQYNTMTKAYETGLYTILKNNLQELTVCDEGAEIEFSSL